MALYSSSKNQGVIITSNAAPRHAWHQDAINVECPARVTAIQQALRNAGMVISDTCNTLHPATHNAVAAIHTTDYLNALREACAQLPDDGSAVVLADPEEPAEYTYITRHSYDDALAAVSACLHAADGVVNQNTIIAPSSSSSSENVMINNNNNGVATSIPNHAHATPWFVAVRPPGHHALASQASGFCLLANVAITVSYMQRHLGLQRVAVVDFDVHHGNGTQAAFYNDPTMLFIDIHQAGSWPSTGHADERGVGEGVGTTVNINMPVGSGDAALRAAYAQQVAPVLEAFAPEALVVSAGFDAHEEDPLGELAYTDATYEFLGRELTAAAWRMCGGRCVFVLEGGYHRDAMARAAVRMVSGTASAGSSRMC